MTGNSSTDEGSRCSSTLVMSTGVIGQPLDMSKILKGVEALARPSAISGGHEGWYIIYQDFFKVETLTPIRILFCFV